MVNCWAQDYAARPSAQEIVSILQSPDCLKLSNAYNTELPYSAVSAAVVVIVDDQQSLWLAHSIDDQHTVTVYEFAENTNFIVCCMCMVYVLHLCMIYFHTLFTKLKVLA